MSPNTIQPDETAYPIADRTGEDAGPNAVRDPDHGPVEETARQVADQAGEVLREAQAQARNLAGEAQDQLREQAQAAQHKAAESLRALADELNVMVHRGKQTGLATDVVRTVGERTEQAARWLDEHGPGDLLDEVRGHARRHPGAFLLGSAALGLVVGRLARGAAGGGRSSGDPRQAEQPPPEPAEPRSVDPGPAEPEPAQPRPTPRTAAEPAVAEPPTVGEYVEEWERSQGVPLSPETSPAAPVEPR